MIPLMTACLLAKLAYDPGDDEAVSAQLTALGYTLITRVAEPSTDSHFFAAMGPDGVVVSLRGTASIANARIDAEILQIACPFTPASVGAYVHRGFTGYYMSVRDRVRACVPQDNALPITVVGHSLGGSSASECALDLALWCTGEVHEVTFGSPRVGNVKWVHVHDAHVLDCVRVVHHEDIVPKMPNLNYEHVAGELHIDDDGKVYDFVGFREFESAAAADLDGQALSDHHIDNYLAAVAAYLKANP